MRPVVAFFAHPDDEAFGPAGTLALLARERDVYLICATNGDAGENNSDKTQELTDIRKEELVASARTLGIKDIFFLDFQDGTLSNKLYHQVAEKVQQILEKLQPSILITLEPRGVSGHLDHVAVSLITSYIFKKVDYVEELWYFCLTKKEQHVLAEQLGDYFVYVPPGYDEKDVTKTVDISAVWEQKRDAAKHHESQKQDVDAHLQIQTVLPHEEHFILIKKHTV